MRHLASSRAGTEYIKSPEMLTVANASSKERANFDRRKKVGANKASDVWGAACVLYELLTGEYLFYDEDWIRFFIRVTGASAEELIPPERLVPLQQLRGGKHLIEFFRNALISDPLRRPSMHDIAQRWQAVASAIAKQPEEAEVPAAPASTAPLPAAAAAAAACGNAGREGGKGKHTWRSSSMQMSGTSSTLRSSSSSSSLHCPPRVEELSAQRVLRDPSRASALLLHESMTATEVDREIQGKSAVSVGMGSCNSSCGHILCGAAPLDLEWVDGRPLVFSLLDLLVQTCKY